MANPRREIDGRQRLFGASQQAYEKVGKAIAAWREHKQALVQAFSQTAEAAYRSALALLGGCAVVAMLISVYLARNISRSITGPVQTGVTSPPRRRPRWAAR